MSQSDLLELEGFPPSRLSVRHFSLMNSLLTVMNSSPRNSPESVLARYFLERFDQLAELNVYDVAEACFTSRSGIRRFCQSIGFENFSELKSCGWEWGKHKGFYGGYAERVGDGSGLTAQISEMMDCIKQGIAPDEIAGLASLIHDAGEVWLVASDFSSMAIREFQQSMLLMHKLVHILTDSSGDAADLRALTDQDLVVVISASGNYARAAERQLAESHGCKVLITAHCDECLFDRFDAVLSLANRARYGERTVYAKYGMAYFFDLLYACYMRMFEDK